MELQNPELLVHRIFQFQHFHCRLYQSVQTIWINDVRDNHHIFKKLFFYFFFSCRKLINTCTGCSNLFLTSSASSRFPVPSAPICLEVLFSFCSQSFNFLFDLSVFFVSSITLSTSSSLLSWNLFLIFCLTFPDFLYDLMSNMFFSSDSYFPVLLYFLNSFSSSSSPPSSKFSFKCFYFLLAEHYIRFTFYNFFPDTKQLSLLMLH